MLGQTEVIPVEHLSLLTTTILLLKGDNVISQGTGFYIVKQDTVKNQFYVFLVTNFHVLTGSSPSENKQPLGDNILFFLHKDPKNPKDIKQIRHPLYNRKNIPLWKSSNKFPEADIAIIPIPFGMISDCKIFAITEDWAKTPMKVRPSSPITLVGYPYGYYDTSNSLPIWKTGSIASEPTFDFDNKPLFVIDISAFPGMSGSPAFSISHGSYETEDGGFAVATGTTQKFLGIYASMQMLNERKYLEEFTNTDKKIGVALSQSLQLGQVWKASLIFDIINNINIEEYEKMLNDK